MKRVLVVLILSAVVAASGADISRPGASGPLAPALQPLVDQSAMAGAVALVTGKDKLLDLETVGYSDLAAKKPMGKDDLFWIASMSKPIATSALMMLVDEGKVKVDDPVAKYLPEFKRVWVVAEEDENHMVLKTPAHPITVKNLLTHTSGIVKHSAVEYPALDRLPLENAVRSYAITPLEFEPGTKYEYSNGGMNTVGRIVEVVSGMPYEKFIAQRIFQPLGMKDTTFFPTEAQLRRLAKAYSRDKQKNTLVEVPIGQLTYPLTDSNRKPMPAGGLFSTAQDMAKFALMILGGGSADGRRYLSEAAVKEMTSVQTGNLLAGLFGYGYGWRVSQKPNPNGMEAGDFFHGGAMFTDMVIARRRQVVLVLMLQLQEEGMGPGGGKIRDTFIKAALDRYGHADGVK